MRLAAHEPDPLERLQLPGHAGRCHAEPVGELDTPEPAVGRVVQLEQQGQIREREPVRAERSVDVANDDRAREREVENGGECGVRRFHVGSISSSDQRSSV